MSFKIGDRVGLLDDSYFPRNIQGTITTDLLLDDGHGWSHGVRFDGEGEPQLVLASVLAPWPHPDPKLQFGVGVREV